MKLLPIISCCLLSASFLLGEEAGKDFSPERKFSNPAKSSSFEATAKKFDGEKVTLVRKGQTTEMVVDIDKLCDEDKAWLTENKDAINESTNDDSDASKDKAKGEPNALGKELLNNTSKLKIKNAKESEFVKSEDTKLNADYFIVVYSASWCPPCRAEMPKVVRFARSIIKDPKVELVLASSDKDIAKALEWATEEKMPFPILFSKDRGLSATINGSSPGGIPHAVLFDGKTRKVITKGYPTEVIAAYKKLKK